MYLEYFPPKTTFFTEVTELDQIWRRDHDGGSNDLESDRSIRTTAINRYV